MRSKKWIGAALVVLIGAGLAAYAVEEKDEHKPRNLKGSIKVEGQHTDAELAKLAKISMEDAEKIALKAVAAKDSDKELGDEELEVEEGFLIYTIEVQVKGKEGVEEFLIDAGNGKVLSHEHEEGDEEDESD